MNDKQQLERQSAKKKVLVTGSSSGIGSAITQRLLKEGYHVVGISRSGSESQFNNDNYENYNLDLSNVDELPDAFEALTKLYSDIHAIVFCAGRGQFGGIEQFSYRQIQSLMNLNFISQAYLARAYIPLFKKRNSGDLIFIGSESALKGGRLGAIYSASKFAVRGMVQALREECSRNSIRVALVNPGMVNSDFFNELDFEPGELPENYIEVDDVAHAVSYILESNSKINVDEINLSPMKHVVRKKK